MPLDTPKGRVITAHASKKSKISFKILEAHTSILVPLLIIPVFPFLTTVKIALVVVLVLILLERRGWTLPLALKRIRSRIAGRYRYKRTRRTLDRRLKINS